ncbi:Pyruvate/Phosphoenolpyruvate kinase-like domain-containing protein [Aspergillus pseudoustus]|uniref:Pyruvate/Phosphoenolpyruvate kinase-like domain-containing protein n=1 Tax=Aspergillus pseudoustus TaxID=1810923 RepID=A0ABR4KL23_9EURO
MLRAHAVNSKIVALPCTYDALSSKLVEKAGFPVVFPSRFSVASSFGLPDTGYIAFQEMTTRIQEAVRQVQETVIADWDTGYGSPMNVRRTVRGFALAGAAGIMIKDQTLIHGYKEALALVRRFIEFGVDCVFVEAMPHKETIQRLSRDVNVPCFANIIEGGKTENTSAQELASLGYCAVSFLFTLVAAKLKGIREARHSLKASLTAGAPPTILSYDEICRGVGFDEYYATEERYQYAGAMTGSRGYQWHD